MPTTYPLATLAPTISSAGISAPTYVDVYESLKALFRSIYGADAYLEPDSQDGQLLAIFARSVHDGNQASIAAYNNFSPATAQGAGLSSAVKLNGLRRLVASNSQVTVTISGQVGTVIASGKVGDAAGNRWSLPSTVTIPGAAFINVTATADKLGAIQALAGAVNKIVTPTAGWQSVTNVAAATPGNPIESDAELRARQATSTSIAALTVLEATVALVASLSGVLEVKPYENDTSATDTNGLPPHSIALVVRGGVAADIAAAIMRKKTPGTYTHGSTSIFVNDAVGITHQIRFFLPTDKPVGAAVTIKALAGYTSATGVLLKQAVADYVNALAIGQSVFLPRLYIPAQLGGVGPGAQYELTALTIGPAGGAMAGTDYAIAFNEQATMLTTDVALTVV